MTLCTCHKQWGKFTPQNAVDHAVNAACKAIEVYRPPAQREAARDIVEQLKRFHKNGDAAACSLVDPENIRLAGELMCRAMNVVMESPQDFRVAAIAIHRASFCLRNACESEMLREWQDRGGRIELRGVQFDPSAEPLRHAVNMARAACSLASEAETQAADK